MMEKVSLHFRIKESRGRWNPGMSDEDENHSGAANRIALRRSRFCRISPLTEAHMLVCSIGWYNEQLDGFRPFTGAKAFFHTGLQEVIYHE